MQQMIDASSVALIVLGAGASSRYGESDKLAVMLNGKPVAHHLLKTVGAFQWGRKILTCRNRNSWTDSYEQQGFHIALVDDLEAGMLGSLHCGLSIAKEHSQVLICLADMPLIPQSHIERLLDARQTSAAPVIASRSKTYRGPPALCKPDYLRALPNKGEGGARSLLPQAEFVVMADPAFHDIDTVHDFETVRQILQQQED